jgi:hypothetical protein
MKPTLRLLAFALLVFSAFQMTGCVLLAVPLVAAPLATGYLAIQDKKAFHYVNLERAKAGLKPLSREEWKHQMNPGEVRRTKGDVAGLHHGGDVRQGQTRRAYSPAVQR